MIAPYALADPQLESPLGRTSPVLKLAIAVVWLVGLAVGVDPRPPIVIAAAALLAGVSAGAIPLGTLARTLAPLWIVALVIALSNALFASVNTDPTATDLIRLGPLRLTIQAVGLGMAVGLRVVAIASVGAVFTLTTDSTRLADSLVQQGHVSDRFAYGALAAYQAIPRFGEDLATLRQARRIRGLRASWHPRLLLGLLVLAIRHGDRLALAMDARAFGSGPRTTYREVNWTKLDAVIGLVALAVLVGALAAGQRMSV
jgi:energy-coupling factor transport system permease protein